MGKVIFESVIRRHLDDDADIVKVTRAALHPRPMERDDYRVNMKKVPECTVLLRTAS